MLVNGWAIALMICSVGILFLGLMAAWCGIKVVCFWDSGADTARQIRLETEVWLTSALMKYALFFQVVSLVMLVLAADAFSGTLVGAMCATGAFLANDYGIVTLLVKIVLVFFCGYWLLLNHLDNQSESYPLVKSKYIFLFFLLPLMVVDAVFQFLYLIKLEPDVLTSCCGVLFKSSSGDGYNLLDPYSPVVLLGSLYLTTVILATSGLQLFYTAQKGKNYSNAILMLNTTGWIVFFPTALWTVIVFFSSYIYAMPSHRCPFDILQANYSYIGFPIYLSLFSATFLGATSGLIEPLKKLAGLAVPVSRYRAMAIPASILFLIIFILITAYAPVVYLVVGGEVS